MKSMRDVFHLIYTKVRVFWRYEKRRGKRLASPLGFCLTVCDESVHAYSDLSWLCLIGFGNLYFKYSVPIGRFDAIVFHGLRQVEGSRKFTCNPLGPVVLDPIGRLFKLSLATKCQYPFVHFRFEVLVSHAGQIGANEIRILTFKNVNRRIPNSS